jgi:hypothetical protein
MVSSHPNLNESYFENIDTREKAYWLGFLYADGGITVNKKTQCKRLVINLHKKDEIIIDKFIEDLNLNKEKKEYHGRQVTIRFSNKKLTADLVSLDCVPKKTHIIKLPKLNSRKIYLAFLLGYFDGDGKQNSTMICSSSRIFMEQIKEKFQIPFKITRIESEGNIDGRKIVGTAYTMCLGAKLFNEMMDNYKNSLPRKRKYFYTNEERIRKIRESPKSIGQKKRFDISKKELEKLVWDIPTVKIAEKFNVSDKAIAKRCKKYRIEKPPRGYWTKFIKK